MSGTSELKEMRDRINGNRQLIVDKLDSQWRYP